MQWVLIIAFAFHTPAGELKGGSFSLDMPSEQICLEEAKDFTVMKFQLGKAKFSSSASCISVGKDDSIET